MDTYDYEVRQHRDGRTMIVALPNGDEHYEMCDDVRATTWVSLEQLREVHRHEFGGTAKFGRAWFIPFHGGRITIRPGIKAVGK